MRLGTGLLGVPTAVALAVAVPLIITLPQSEPFTISVQQTQQAKPEPKAAAVKVRISGDIGGPRAAFISLRAAGQPPKKSTLVDETGRHTATIEKAADNANCPKPPRNTGIGTEPWCLVTSHVDAGHELSGTVTGKKTKLAVTLDRKNGFLGWPLAVLLFGLGASLLVAVWSGWLKSLIQRLKLKRLLAQNDDATDHKIRKLDVWAEDQLKEGADVEVVLGTVSRVMASGPTQAHEARERLKSALERLKPMLQQRGLPPTSPYIRKATEEASRTSHTADDFLVKGKQRDSHPAAEYEAGITKIASYLEALAQLEDEVRTNLLEPCKGECERRITQARLMVPFVSAEQLKNLDDELVECEAAYAAALARKECLAQGFAGDEAAGRTQARQREFRSLDVEAVQLELGEGALGALTAGAWLLTGVSILVALTFAGVTVHQAAYAPNNTFATSSDYFKLFSAALATGAAATVVSLLGYWQLPKGAPSAGS